MGRAGGRRGEEGTGEERLSCSGPGGAAARPCARRRTGGRLSRRAAGPSPRAAGASSCSSCSPSASPSAPPWSSAPSSAPSVVASSGARGVGLRARRGVRRRRGVCVGFVPLAAKTPGPLGGEAAFIDESVWFQRALAASVVSVSRKSRASSPPGNPLPRRDVRGAVSVVGAIVQELDVVADARAGTSPLVGPFPSHSRPIGPARPRPIMTPAVPSRPAPPAPCPARLTAALSRLVSSPARGGRGATTDARPDRRRGGEAVASTAP